MLASVARRVVLPRYRAAAISTTATTTTTTNPNPKTKSIINANYSLFPRHPTTSSSLQKRLFSSTIVRLNNPSLYTWGTDKSGCLLQQYDNDDTDPSTKNNNIVWEPKLTDLVTNKNLLPSSDKIIDVCCGSSEIMLVTDDGKVWVAGENKNGNLGVGHTDPVKELTELKVNLRGGINRDSGDDHDHGDHGDSGNNDHRSGSDNKDIDTTVLFQKGVLGPNTGALIAQNGDLYTFGNGGSVISGVGCLGLGNAESFLTPQLVHSLAEDGCRVRDVALGESHSTVLTTEGEVLTTGAANYGRLGNGETYEDTLYFDSVEILSLLPNETVTQISGGESFTLALTNDGVIYGWGRNHKGQLGTGFGMAVDMYAMEQIPTPMDGEELVNRTVTKVAAGTNHAACVTSGGELFWWGSSIHLEPVRVDEVLHTKIIDIACGLDYTLALSEDNELFAWGAGKTGVLGVGPDTKTLHQAQMIKSLLKKDNEIVSMSAGSTFASCLVSEL